MLSTNTSKFNATVCNGIVEKIVNDCCGLGECESSLDEVQFGFFENRELLAVSSLFTGVDEIRVITDDTREVQAMIVPATIEVSKEIDLSNLIKYTVDYASSVYLHYVNQVIVEIKIRGDQYELLKQVISEFNSLIANDGSRIEVGLNQKYLCELTKEYKLNLETDPETHRFLFGVTKQ